MIVRSVTALSETGWSNSLFRRRGVDFGPGPVAASIDPLALRWFGLDPVEPAAPPRRVEGVRLLPLSAACRGRLHCFKVNAIADMHAAAPVAVIGLPLSSAQGYAAKVPSPSFGRDGPVLQRRCDCQHGNFAALWPEFC